MCTVLVRLDPLAPWPVVLGAVRDEFVERLWDPPARHWSGPWAGFVGGRDRTAGGTWLAVDPDPNDPAVAAVLNGGRREPLPGGAARPTRGELVLRALADGAVPSGEALEAYDCFHLLVARAGGQDLWSWDGVRMEHRPLPPGPHIVVNAGLDAEDDPLVPHFTPLLAALPDPEPEAGEWRGWTELLAGDGLAGEDDRALVVEKLVEERPYGSTSAALVALSADGRVRYDFTATPADPSSWRPVIPAPR